MQDIINKIWEKILKQGFAVTLLAVLVVVLYRNSKEYEEENKARIKYLEQELAQCMRDKYINNRYDTRRQVEDEM